MNYFLEFSFEFTLQNILKLPQKKIRKLFTKEENWRQIEISVFKNRKK